MSSSTKQSRPIKQQQVIDGFVIPKDDEDKEPTLIQSIETLKPLRSNYKILIPKS